MTISLSDIWRASRYGSPSMPLSPFSRSSRSSFNQLRLQVVVQLNALLDDVEGVETPHEALDLDLFVFERLVVFEKPLDRFQPVFRQLGDVAVVAGFWVVVMVVDDLIVLFVLVYHLHDADGLGAHDAERRDLDLAEHEYVERVVVVAVGPRQEAVIGWVMDGAEQHAVD